jgi:hypothetical protein
MGKNLLIKITMGESPNEMGNCPFAPPPLVALLRPGVAKWQHPLFLLFEFTK